MMSQDGAAISTAFIEKDVGMYKIQMTFYQEHTNPLKKFDNVVRF